MRKLEDLEIYQIAMDLGERVWAIVKPWDFLARDTLGKQLVRAADSVAANISEGFGRYHYADSKRFAYYARGSLFETRTWLIKARRRDLVEPTDFDEMINDTRHLGVKLNNYIKSIGTTAPEKGPLMRVKPNDASQAQSQ